MDDRKVCSRCGVLKSFSEYYKDKRSKDGLYSHCKECHYEGTRVYATTEKGKKAEAKSKAKWYYEGGGKEKTRIRGSTPERRRARAEWEKTEAGKASRRKAYLKRKAERGEALKAKQKVNNAVKGGELPHISTQKCAECGEQAKEYHHESYAENKRLVVVPLCKKCHAATYTNPY